MSKFSEVRNRIASLIADGISDGRTDGEIAGEILADPDVLVKASNQERPESPYSGCYASDTRREWFAYVRALDDMLTPSKGEVWVKCKVGKEG